MDLSKLLKTGIKTVFLTIKKQVRLSCQDVFGKTAVMNDQILGKYET